MVDQAKIDLSMTTIAILTAPPQQTAIDQKELEQILTPPLTIGQSSQGLLVSSQKDQIQVLAGGIKTNVRDLRGRRRFSTSKIPAILSYFIKRFNLQVTSYGVNFVINLPCVEPAKWIGDNILSTQISQKTGQVLLGGIVTVKMEAGQKTWNIKFEPSSDKMINVDFNASEDTTQLPNQKRLREELQEQFDALLGFLNKLEL
ncbi:hypothetical protein ES703_75430 [subsurface metagenome]